MKNSGHIKWYKSIQTKTTLWLTALLTLILLGLGAFQVIQIKETLESELKMENANTGIRLSKHIELPLWQLDKELVKASVESEMLNEDVYGIVILDESKKLFLGIDRDKNWKTSKLPAGSFGIGKNDYTGALISSTKKISHKGKIIGLIEVYSSDKFNVEKIKDASKAQLLQAIIVILIVIFVMFLVLRKLVISPLKEITEKAYDVSRGDFSVDLEVKTQDEVGELTNSIKLLKRSFVLAAKLANNSE